MGREIEVSVDVEGTLADIHTPFVEKYNSLRGTGYTVGDISDYDFSGLPIDIDEFLEITDHLWKCSWRDVPPLEDDISEKISQLRENYPLKIDVVTSREGCRGEMTNWLDRIGIPYSEFTVEKEKHELGYDLYVDDNPTLALRTENLVLYDRPWNKNLEDGNCIRRIGADGDGFSELSEVLDSYFS